MYVVTSVDSTFMMVQQYNFYHWSSNVHFCTKLFHTLVFNMFSKKDCSTLNEFIHSLTHSCMHAHTQISTHTFSIAHSLVLTNSLIHLLTHPPIHPSILSDIYVYYNCTLTMILNYIFIIVTCCAAVIKCQYWYRNILIDVNVLNIIKNNNERQDTLNMIKYKMNLWHKLVYKTNNYEHKTMTASSRQNGGK